MADASHDAVNHPAHYTFGAVEVIDAIEAWGLGFHLGNAVKYIARAERKGTRLQDLRKARWYLDREIERSEQAEDTGEPQLFVAREPHGVWIAVEDAGGAGPGAPCCPKCARPHHEAGSYTMLRCSHCNHVWERASAEVEHG